jgi:hypothetical protein
MGTILAIIYISIIVPGSMLGLYYTGGGMADIYRYGPLSFELDHCPGNDHDVSI